MEEDWAEPDHQSIQAVAPHSYARSVLEPSRRKEGKCRRKVPLECVGLELRNYRRQVRRIAFASLNAEQHMDMVMMAFRAFLSPAFTTSLPIIIIFNYLDGYYHR